ncbi:MAG: RNA polymerase sigma factor [Planctomycetota bacterium]
MSPPLTLAERGSTGPQDLLLVKRALRGEADAVEGLLQRLACIHRFVFRLNRTLGYGLPTDVLEDVVQQVYGSVWPRLRDYIGSAAIESWVFGFCRNCLRSEARGRRRGASVLDPSDDRVATDASGEGTAVHVVAREEGVDALRAELARLDPDERAVVEMRFLHEQSFEHIARMLGVPPSTVKDRCYRALERLKGRLRRRDVSA